MNKITLLAGIAIGAVLTAGVAQLQAQAPAAANTTRPAVFVITLQNITDQAKYDKDYAPAVTKSIKDSGGRFIVRGGEVTSLAGESAQARCYSRLRVDGRSQEVAEPGNTFLGAGAAGVEGSRLRKAATARNLRGENRR
jgi:hypothetical protein